MSTPTLGAWLRLARGRFAEAGLDAPALDAALLAEAVTGLDRADQRRIPETPLAADTVARLEELAARRLAGEPTSRVLGRREFWSLDFLITPAVLDPRPDSEVLIEAALACLPARDAPWRICDLGTGSGCLLIALLHERPAATGRGLDSSGPALAVARENARRLGVAARARFEEGDFADWSGGPFDLVLCNPPYIPSAEIAGLALEVRAHDPRAALDGGPDGLAPYRLLARRLPGLLAPGGYAVLEHGHDQARAVQRIFHDCSLHLTRQCHDLGGRVRAAVLRRPERKELEI